MPVKKQAAAAEQKVDLSPLQSDIAGLKKDLASVKSSVRGLEGKASSSDLKKLESKLNSLEAKLKDLESNLSSPSDSSNNDGILKALEVFCRTADPRRWDYAKRKAKI